MIKESTTVISVFALALSGLLLALLSACTTKPVQQEEYIYQEAYTYVDGTFFYQERIALKPGSYAYVALNDVSKMDVPATTIISQKIELDGQQVPVAYQLKVPADSLDPRHRYSVHVEIRDQADILLWRSDRIHPVNPVLQEQTLDPIQLVRINHTAASVNPLQNTKWRVEDINRRGVVDRSMTTLEFGRGGQLAGNAGCNQYSTAYKANQYQLSVGMIKVTQRACIPVLADQEARFLKTLKEAQKYVLNDENGMLVIQGENDSLIKAARME